MNVKTYLEAKELYDKYSLCESVLEYLSDNDLPQGLKYLETLKMFVNVFPNDFMMFVHNKMQEIGAMFEELHCPEHSESGLQPPILPPTEEKDPKFPIGSKVEVVSGIGKGDVGVVKEYDPTADRYYVVSDKFYMWFAEYELQAYVEEQPETPTPPEDDDDKYEMVYGERVIVKSGEYAGKVGTIIDVMVGFTKILVGLDDVEDAVEFTPDQLAKYTDPEWKEGNDGSASNTVYGQKFDGTADVNNNGNG